MTSRTYNSRVDDIAICPACDGSGFGVADTFCGYCGGSGGVPPVAAERLIARKGGDQ
jgi:DnaJ-class molecular chaperone